MIEIGADTVHLVHERDARDAVLVGLPPDGFRLRLHAGHGIENSHAAVQDAQRALHFDGKVHVTRRINDIDQVGLIVTLPARRGGRRGNGDPALALLLHPVHRGRAFVHFTDLVGHARIEQDAFGRSGLSGVNMGHDADVARVLELWFA